MMKNQLDNLAIHYLYDLNLNECEPIEIQMDQAVTICPKNADAFILQSPTSESVKHIVSESVVNDASVVRMLISYKIASTISSNPKLFNFYFSLWLNAGLSSLKKKIGDLSFRDITCLRPGRDNEVFRELEDFAAFELRIFVKAKNT